ncbi:MAG: hypothetical protein JO352_35840 [Chloroflexi bacterium]|nr:hypothetical protein [Chloroflexota bacterium]MBV9598838.1 hypothetical protein [Chloroflexota bacterium]
MPTLLSALGMQAASQPAIDLVGYALHVEQVLSAGSSRVRLVEACPPLHLVVTSRAVVHLSGERMLWR